MKKITLLSIPLFIVVFSGCSQKTVYPQVYGDLPVLNKKQKVTLNKEKLLNEVDSYANYVFSNLSKMNKKLNDSLYNQVMNSIYHQRN